MGSLFLSILANVISILIEYGIIKPKFETRWGEHLPKSGNRDWVTAIKKSIGRFGETQGGHIIPFGEHYQVEKIKIEKGRGILDLVVLPKSALVFTFAGLSAFIDALKIDTFPNVIARYQITIDRSGDVLAAKSLPVADDERYRPLHPSKPLFSDHTNPPKEGLILKEIKRPKKKTTSEGVTIRIEFIVENYGMARAIYPFVEYKIAELKNGKFVERIIRSPSDWMVILQASSITPIAFDASFSAETQVLTKGKDRVYVRIHKKPWHNPR